eukprot:SAG11_NODE_18840_length_480_cov_0.790026_1_plen_73_part_00
MLLSLGWLADVSFAKRFLDIFSEYDTDRSGKIERAFRHSPFTIDKSPQIVLRGLLIRRRVQTALGIFRRTAS